MICEATQRNEIEIVVLSLQCLSRIVSLYYPLLEDYLKPAIWPISINAVSSSVEALVVQGPTVMNLMGRWTVHKFKSPIQILTKPLTLNRWFKFKPQHVIQRRSSNLLNSVPGIRDLELFMWIWTWTDWGRRCRFRMDPTCSPEYSSTSSPRY